MNAYRVRRPALALAFAFALAAAAPAEASLRVCNRTKTRVGESLTIAAIRSGWPPD